MSGANEASSARVVLVLCTGTYYRSRHAEAVYRGFSVHLFRPPTLVAMPMPAIRLLARPAAQE